MSRPIARIDVSNDGCLIMANYQGAASFPVANYASIENLGRSHYIQWDAGFEKAMDTAMQNELLWLASLYHGDIDRESAVWRIKNRVNWQVGKTALGNTVVYLLKWPDMDDSQEKQPT